MRLRDRPVNPVLGRELRERLRTRRAALVVVGYLVVLAIVLYVTYRARVGGSQQIDVFAGPIATQAASVGQTLFETVLSFMVALVLFIVPAVTADAFTGERERQTLVPLQVTLLRPRAIVFGKLLTSLAFVSLLLLASLPLLGISFITGGVSAGQVLRGLAAVFVTAVFAGCVALACSSVARRTSASLVLSLGVVFLFVAGSTLGYFAQRLVDDDERHPPLGVLIVNPFFGVADIVADFDPARSWSVDSPLEPMRRVIAEREGQLAAANAGAEMVFEDPPARARERIERVLKLSWWERQPFWMRSFGVIAWVSILSFGLAALRLRTPTKQGST